MTNTNDDRLEFTHRLDRQLFYQLMETVTEEDALSFLDEIESISVMAEDLREQPYPITTQVILFVKIITHIKAIWDEVKKKKKTEAIVANIERLMAKIIGNDVFESYAKMSGYIMYSNSMNEHHEHYYEARERKEIFMKPMFILQAEQDEYFNGERQIHKLYEDKSLIDYLTTPFSELKKRDNQTIRKEVDDIVLRCTRLKHLSLLYQEDRYSMVLGEAHELYVQHIDDIIKFILDLELDLRECHLHEKNKEQK